MAFVTRAKRAPGAADAFRCCPPRYDSCAEVRWPIKTPSVRAGRVRGRRPSATPDVARPGAAVSPIDSRNEWRRGSGAEETALGGHWRPCGGSAAVGRSRSRACTTRASCRVAAKATDWHIRRYSDTRIISPHTTNAQCLAQHRTISHRRPGAGCGFSAHRVCWGRRGWAAGSRRPSRTRRHAALRCSVTARRHGFSQSPTAPPGLFPDTQTFRPTQQWALSHVDPTLHACAGMGS